MQGNELKTYLSERAKAVDAQMKCYFDRECTSIDLTDGMRYSLFAGGKRVRPILAIATSEALGSNADSVMPFACALEYIHTYSLIHDDLPSMDDDDLRRGNPTNHKKFGEAEAILAGDGLLTDAFTLIATQAKDATVGLRVVQAIAQGAGSDGMVGGQMLDIKNTGKTIDETTLRQIHAAKTGALITAAVQVGAIAGNATNEEFDALTTFGEKIGLAFQVVDDVLDVIGGEAIGKDVMSDANAGKPTFATVLGVDASKRLARTTLDEALSAIHGFDHKADALRGIASYIVERTN